MPAGKAAMPAWRAETPVEAALFQAGSNSSLAEPIAAADVLLRCLVDVR